jgi:hypothetical protein
MADNQSDNVLIRELPMLLIAQWETDHVSKVLDSTADGVTRPTMLVGSKRRKKVESFPTLRLTARLKEVGREAGVVSNVTVDELEGHDVVFQLTNKYYHTPPKQPIEYHAKLRYFEAVVELSEAEVRDVVFKRGGQLNAKVNENLLDFTVKIPDFNLATDSDNRLLIYRNRIIVFVPGLLGSTIAIKTSKGLVQVYPNIYPTMSDGQQSEVGRFFDTLDWFTPQGTSKGIKYISEVAEHRHLGVLECDAQGKPLFQSKPDFFRLLGAVPIAAVKKKLSAGVVYDVQGVLADRWNDRGQYTNRPSGFEPFLIVPWPYDWRLDLEESAQQLFQELQTQQKKLIQADDTDDLFVISGHSTGGVINRRVCGLPGVGDLIEHSFFMNAPFRGAPKALSVMLFGGDPPLQGHYKPMMPAPLIDADSMVYIAENLPIVYFLSPSNFYPDPVSSLSDDLCQACSGMVQSSPSTRDGEKENLIQAAIATGIYHPMLPVPSSASAQQREKLALGALEWHQKWWDCSRRKMYGVYWDQRALDLHNQQELISDDNLKYQQATRMASKIGWNRDIAGNAARFHRLSEEQIGNSAVELYIFWSQNNSTTGSVGLKLDGTPEKTDVLSMGVSIDDYFLDGKYPVYRASASFDFRFQWWKERNSRQWVKFTATLVDGDGTVPRASLLGIGTSNAKIFLPIPGDPAHVPAPNADFVWDRVLDVLTQRDISGYLANSVKPENAPFTGNRGPTG